MKENGIIGEHVLDGCHDMGGRKVLPRLEDRLEDDNDEKDDGKGEVGRPRVRTPQRHPVSQFSGLTGPKRMRELKERCERPYQAMEETALAASSGLPKPPNTQPTTCLESGLAGATSGSCRTELRGACLRSFEAGLLAYG